MAYPIKYLEETLVSFKGKLKASHVVLEGPLEMNPVKKNEAIKTAGQVQYVGQAGEVEREDAKRR